MYHHFLANVFRQTNMYYFLLQRQETYKIYQYNQFNSGVFEKLTKTNTFTQKFFFRMMQ